MIKNLLKITLISTILGANAFVTPSLAAERELDYAVAVADNNIILASELKANVARYKKNAQAQHAALPDDHIIAKNILEHMIISSLISQLAEKKGFVISDADIDRYLNRYAQDTGGMNELLEKARREGLTEEEVRNEIRNEIIANEVKRSQIRSRITISDQEVEQLALALKEQNQGRYGYHIANIVVRLPDNPTPAQEDTASRRIRQIQKELEHGLSFAEAAKRYSEGNNALKGGDMGTLPAEEMPEQIASGVVNAEPGAVIGPIKSKFGFMLIKVYERKALKPEPVEQVQIRHILIKTSIIFDDEKAKAKLDSFRAEIENGDAKFSDLASRFSEDPITAANGGFMDWVNPEAFDPGFRNAIASLKVGQISAPFKSSYGWHIAVVENRKVDTDSLEAYKVKAREIIFNRNYREESEKWEQELRDSAFVKIYGLK